MRIAIVLSGMEPPLLQERAIAAMLAQRLGMPVLVPRPVKPTYGDDGTVKPITKGGNINEVA